MSVLIFIVLTVVTEYTIRTGERFKKLSENDKLLRIISVNVLI
jgi:hypothetical protein